MPLSYTEINNNGGSLVATAKGDKKSGNILVSISYIAKEHKVEPILTNIPVEAYRALASAMNSSFFHFMTESNIKLLNEETLSKETIVATEQLRKLSHHL